MSDELLVRMKTAVGAGQMIKALDEGAAEIVRLNAALDMIGAERDALRALLAESALWVREFDGTDSELLAAINTALKETP
jgi:hypothetical protein